MKKSLKTIALVWEMGVGLGHIATFLPVAKALKNNGYRPILILRDVSEIEKMYAGEDIEYIQAPIWLSVRHNMSGAQLNFTDTLFNFGYLDVKGLSSMIKSWKNLFDIIKPDLFVFDHSPTALLASRVISAPKIILGNCFSVPPQLSPMPAYIHWQDNRRHQDKMISEENICVDNINKALVTIGADKIHAVHEIYSSDYCFIRTDPLIDVYPRNIENKKIEYLGSINTNEIGSDNTNWPLSTLLPKIFIYLKSNYKHLEALLECCSMSKAQYIIYSSGINSGFVEKYTKENIVFSKEPINIEKIRKECDGAMAHGGNLIDKFLESGVPLLLLPMQMENLMMSKKAVMCGAALSFHLSSDPEIINELLNRLISDEKLKISASAVSNKMLNLNQQTQMDIILQKIESLLCKTD
jgi:UDP:flavonoid glycosyltransferase YjiC (YdhE family)